MKIESAASSAKRVNALAGRFLFHYRGEPLHSRQHFYTQPGRSKMNPE